jgi:hypothetical protein
LPHDRVHDSGHGILDGGAVRGRIDREDLLHDGIS